MAEGDTQEAHVRRLAGLYQAINESLSKQIEAQITLSGIESGKADAELEAMGAAARTSMAAVRRGFRGGTAEVDNFSSSIEELRRRNPAAAASFGALDRAATGFGTAIGTIAPAYDNAMRTAQAMAAGPTRNLIKEIDDIYGGITLATAAARDGTIHATNSMSEGLTNVALGLHQVNSHKREFGDTGAYYTLGAALGTTSEQFAVFNDLAMSRGLINALAMQELAMSDFGAESALQMRAASMAMGLNAEETGTFVQRQISLTGKAGTEMLSNAALFSKSVAKTTGASQKLISKSMQEIISDTQNFGNVTVEEAARISGTLYELGIDFKDLGGMVNKFMSFEGAVESISALTTVFGVQMDAMEMMKLANTDQEMFLRKIREGFQSTSRSVDDMTNADKRLIQSMLGLGSVESVERLLDFSEPLSSIEELSAGMEEITPEEGIARTQELFDVLGDDMLRFAELNKLMSDDVYTALTEGATAGMKEFYIATEQSAALLHSEFFPAADEMAQIQENAANLAKPIFDEIFGQAGGSADALSETIVSAFRTAVEQLKAEGFFPKSPSIFDSPFIQAGETAEATGKIIEKTFGDRVIDAFGSATYAARKLTDAMTKDVTTSMWIAEGAMVDFSSVSKEELAKLTDTSGTTFNQMARQIGYLYPEFDSLTEAGRKAIAEQLQLGDNWESKLDVLFASQAVKSGASQKNMENVAVSLLEMYQRTGDTIDTLGGMGSELGKEMSRLFEDEAEGVLRQVLEGDPNVDVRAVVAEAIDKRVVAEAEAQDRRAVDRADRTAAVTGASNGARDRHLSSIQETNSEMARLLRQHLGAGAGAPAAETNGGQQTIQIVLQDNGTALMEFVTDRAGEFFNGKNILTGPQPTSTP